MISLIALFTAVAVFLALNETFAWLTFFQLGTGQNFGAGDIKVAYTPSYATYVTAGDAYSHYYYLPADDLCQQPGPGDISPVPNYEKLGFNLSLVYTTKDMCALRFFVEYKAQADTLYSQAYDTDYTYTGDDLIAFNNSLVSVKFSSDFVCRVEDGQTYWYYMPGGAEALAAAPNGAGINNILSKLILSGPNVVNATGKLTISIVATVRQHRANGSITWTNFKNSSFNITVP